MKLIGFVLCFVFSFQVIAKNKQTFLFSGELKDIRLKHLAGEKFKINSKKMPSVSLQYNSKDSILRVRGLQPGFARIEFIRKSDESVIERLDIKVLPLRFADIQREVRALLKDISGISVKVASNRVVIDGYVLTPEEINRIHKVQLMYADDVISLVRIRPDTETQLAEKIEADIGNPNISVRVVNGRYILEGEVTSEAERQRAEIIAKAHVQDKVVSQGEADGKIIPRK